MPRSNNNSFAMLERDVNNMREVFGRCGARPARHGVREGDLEDLRIRRFGAGFTLTGRFARETGAADVDAVLQQIEEERLEAEARQRRRELAEAR